MKLSEFRSVARTRLSRAAGYALQRGRAVYTRAMKSRNSDM